MLAWQICKCLLVQNLQDNKISWPIFRTPKYPDQFSGHRNILTNIQDNQNILTNVQDTKISWPIFRTPNRRNFFVKRYSECHTADKYFAISFLRLPQSLQIYYLNLFLSSICVQISFVKYFQWHFICWVFPLSRAVAFFANIKCCHSSS